MSVSRFRVSRVAGGDGDPHMTATMLGFALGYDAVADQGERVAQSAPFFATVTSDIDDPTLGADWARLEANGIASVFQSFSWQKGLVAHLLPRSGANPLFVTLRSAANGEALAIFPLQRRRRRGLWQIEYLGVDFCDTCQPLLAPNSLLSTEARQTLIATLLDALPPADIVRLAKMQRDLFGTPNPFADLSRSRPSPDQTFPVSLHADDPAFVGATSAYKSYQKQWRKLSRRDGVAFERFETPEAIGTAFDAMIAMRNARFTDLNRDDLLNDREVASFYRAMALLPDPDRVARMCGLKVGDTYTAYIYMLERAGKFSTVISAIDNTVGNAYAPGLILFTKIFERAVEESFAFGDIGIGYMHYKTRFAARQNPLFVFEQALSFKGRVMLSAEGVVRHVKDVARTNPIVRTVAEKILRRKVAPAVDAAAVGKKADESTTDPKADEAT